jgi:hypothetical protein
MFEIWETDPIGGGGCACNPVHISQVQADRIIKVMREREETVKRLRADFPMLKIERDIVHPQRSRSGYPDYVRELLDEGADPPLFFYNNEFVHGGSFPTYEELRAIIERARN